MYFSPNYLTPTLLEKHNLFWFFFNENEDQTVLYSSVLIILLYGWYWMREAEFKKWCQDSSSVSDPTPLGLAWLCRRSSRFGKPSLRAVHKNVYKNKSQQKKGETPHYTWVSTANPLCERLCTALRLQKVISFWSKCFGSSSENFEMLMPPIESASFFLLKYVSIN